MKNSYSVRVREIQDIRVSSGPYKPRRPIREQVALSQLDPKTEPEVKAMLLMNTRSSENLHYSGQFGTTKNGYSSGKSEHKRCRGKMPIYKNRPGDTIRGPSATLAFEDWLDMG